VFRKFWSSLDLGIDLGQNFIFSCFFGEGHIHNLLFLALLLLLIGLFLIGALFGTRDVLGLCFLVLFRLNVIVVLVLRSEGFPNSNSCYRMLDRSKANRGIDRVTPYRHASQYPLNTGVSSCF
jgi:hypothetical protein